MDAPIEEIVDLTKELIKYRSTEDRETELVGCIAFIKQYFIGTTANIVEYSYKGKPALFISYNRAKKQDLILNGHIDVVEGFESQFDAKVEGDKLIGRGSADMKGAVAAFMVLIKHMDSLKKKPRVGLMIVSDEEIGGLAGTKMLVKKGYTGKFVITGETSRFNVETMHKGCLRVKLIAYGTSSHGSRPWLGENAIEKLMRQYHKLIDEVPRATAKHKWLVSINPTAFVSTGPFNVTPSKAEMVLDVRTTEDMGNRKFIDILKRLNIKHKKLLECDMLLTDKKNSYVRTLKRTIEHVLGRKVKYIKSCGGSDTRFFSVLGMPAVNFGPVGRNHHKHTEYCEISSLAKYYEILDTLIKENFS